MQINKLTILGLSEPTITMILDNLESCLLFPEILICNNLNRADLKPFFNPLFKIFISKDFDNEAHNANLFLGVNKPGSKNKVIDQFNAANLNFINIINHTAAISSTVSTGAGFHVNSLVSVAAFARIGNFVSINRNASIGHHAVIGDFVTVNPGANIAGFVKIGKGTLIGMGVNVVDGVEIGEGSIIGAGSVVTKNIPDRVIAYGNPCKIIRDNDT